MKKGNLAIEREELQRKKFCSIRTKFLIYFVLLFLIILFAILLMDIWGIPFTQYTGMQGLARTEASRSLNLIADLKKERLQSWIKERRADVHLFFDSELTIACVGELLQVIGELTEDVKKSTKIWDLVRQEKSFATLKDFLEKIKTIYDTSHEIQIADARTGTIFASTDEADLGKDLSQQSYFTATLRSKHDYISSIEIDVTDQKQRPALHLGHLIRNLEGDVVAVLIMEIDTEGFLKPILHTGKGLGEGGEALLVNKDGVILTSLKHSLPTGGKAKVLEYRITAEPALRAARGENGIVEAVDYRGEPVLAAYRYIQVTPEWGWGLVVKRDKAELFAPLTRNKIYTFLVGLIALVIFTWVAIVLAGNLTRPLKSLSQTAERVAKGDLTTRSQVTTSDEMGLLAITFNLMIESINSRTLELKALNEKLIEENSAHKQTKATLQRRNQNQTIMNRILNISLEPYDLEKILDLVLDVILEIPWIPLTKTAAIFTVRDNPTELIMTAYRGLSSDLESRCARLPFGKCVCGLAAESKKIQFIICSDNRHDIRPHAMDSHGHYCVPILSEDKVLGVLNLYISEKHRRLEEEEIFLQAVANILAGIINRKKMEEQLKIYSQSLEQMVEERTKELRRAQDDLVRKEKLAVVGQLASSVGHELRNPLGVIGNSAYYLNMRLKDPDEKIKKHVNILQREVERANKIISDLLDFSRASLPSLEKVEINSLLNSTLNHIKIPDNIILEAELSDKIPVVSADPGQIEQVFQNIILNAVQAMSTGGRLGIKTAVKDNFIEIKFNDSGKGIAEENLQDIFEPLYTTKTIGTGLGLSIVKSIVDKHQGQIEVESEPDKGTTFTVKLALYEKE